MFEFHTVPEALEALRQGKIILVELNILKKIYLGFLMKHFKGGEWNDGND